MKSENNSTMEYDPSKGPAVEQVLQCYAHTIRYFLEKHKSCTIRDKDLLAMPSKRVAQQLAELVSELLGKPCTVKVKPNKWRFDCGF